MLIAAVLLTLSASAALTAVTIVPGTKGQLPEFPQLAGPVAGQFAGLCLDYVVCSDGRGFNAVITFPYVRDIESADGAYYTIQVREEYSDGWVDYINPFRGEDYPDQISGSTWATGVYIASDTDIRLVLHGGAKDGWVSNAVGAKAPETRVITESRSEPGMSTSTIYPLVGMPLLYTCTMRVGETDYTNENGNFTYQWYRRNPNNYAMHAISGATASSYTPTMEDVGYQLIIEVHGENSTSFYFRTRGTEVVHMPVRVSLAYMGEDGFVLNSEYELPQPLGQCLKYKVYQTIDDVYVETENTCEDVIIKERQPGQYAFYWPVLQQEGSYLQALNNGFIVGDLPVSLTCEAYGRDYTGDYTENNPKVNVFTSSVISSLFRAKSIQVTPTFNGERLNNSTVDIIGPNMDGELMVKASRTLTEERVVNYLYFSYSSNADEICLLYRDNGYYVRLNATEGTTGTYYDGADGALLWSDATLVDASTKSPNITIEAKPAFAPLTGSGIIEGTVSNGAAGAKAFEPAEVDETVYTIYLRQKGGDIVAQTMTDGSGKYRFENVPFGTYEVLVNIDGCVQEQPAQVTLTDSQPTVSGVDYSVDGTEILVTAIRTVTAGQTSAPAAIYTLDGRKVSTPQRGIHIVRQADGQTQKVVVR